MKTTTFLVLLTTSLAIRNQIAADGGEYGAASSRLSLGEVTSAVLENNPAIKEAEKRWRAAEERVPQAAAWDDPRIGGDSDSYFRLANAYDQLEINSKNVTSLGQIADISRTRYENGLESAANVLVAETDHSKLLETRRDLERNLSDAQSQLNTLMNRDAFAPLGAPAAASIKEANLSLARLRQIAFAQRPEVQMARAKIDTEKAKLQLAHRAWIPDPALMVKGQRYNDAAQAVSELDAGVSFTIPWVNPGKYSAGVREAGASVTAAEHGFDREQKEALRLLRDQLQKIETMHHHVELFRDKLVPQAQQAFEAERLSYESGKASFLDWITAQRNLRDIEAMGREHLANYQIALTELEAVIGAEIYARPAERRQAERKSP